MLVNTFLILIFLSYIAFKSQKEVKDFLRSLLSSIMLYINAFAMVATLADMKEVLLTLEILGILSGLYILFVDLSFWNLIKRLLAIGALFGILYPHMDIYKVLITILFFIMVDILKSRIIASMVLTTFLTLDQMGYDIAKIPLLIGVGWIASSVFHKDVVKEALVLKKTEWVTLLHSLVFSILVYPISKNNETLAFALIFVFLYSATLYIIKSLEKVRRSSQMAAEKLSRKLRDIIDTILGFDPENSVDEYLDQILKNAAELIKDVDGGVIEIYDRGVYRFKVVLEYDFDKLKDIYFTEDEIAKSKKPVIIKNIMERNKKEGKFKNEKFQKLAEALPDIKATLMCPLWVKDKFYGGIFLDNFTNEEAFSQEDIETIEIFGKIASIFLEMKIKAQENERMSKRLGLLVKLGGEGVLASDRATVYRKAYDIVKELYGDVLNLFVWTELREGMWTGVAIDRDGNTILLDVPEGEGVMSVVLREGKTMVVHDVDKNEKFYEIIPGTGSMIGVPIHYKGSFYGGLDIEITEKYYFKDEDVIFFEDLANALGLIFKHYENVEKVENLYYSIIKSLASAVDMKDPYTYGHSDRVAYYAMGIAKAMGLDKKVLNNIKYGATLHDIGKIGIPHNILNKESQLSDKEWKIIKSHTILGYNTVKDIPDFKDVAGIIKWHHERWDGKGYPDGLRGEQIPIEARIIAVADTFDAMTSSRPYRKAMAVETALKELKKAAGTQLDPKVVETAVNVLEDLWINYRKEHAEILKKPLEFVENMY